MKHLSNAIRIVLGAVAVMATMLLFPPEGPVAGQDDSGCTEDYCPVDDSYRRCSPPSPKGNDPCGCWVCDAANETCCFKIEGIVVGKR